MEHRNLEKCYSVNKIKRDIPVESPWDYLLFPKVKSYISVAILEKLGTYNRPKRTNWR